MYVFGGSAVLGVQSSSLEAPEGADTSVPALSQEQRPLGFFSRPQPQKLPRGASKRRPPETFGGFVLNFGAFEPMWKHSFCD